MSLLKKSTLINLAVFVFLLTLTILSGNSGIYGFNGDGILIYFLSFILAFVSGVVLIFQFVSLVCVTANENECIADKKLFIIKTVQFLLFILFVIAASEKLYFFNVILETIFILWLLFCVISFITSLPLIYIFSKNKVKFFNAVILLISSSIVGLDMVTVYLMTKTKLKSKEEEEERPKRRDISDILKNMGGVTYKEVYWRDVL